MPRPLRPLALALALALALVILAGCGGTRTELCPGLTCPGHGLQPDYNRCLCTCGPPDVGPICSEADVCSGDPAHGYQCTSPRCDAVQCQRGMFCDPRDGTCICDTETHTTCGEGEQCVGGVCDAALCAGVDCGRAGDCDPQDGVCRCDGVHCGPGEGCAGDPGSRQCVPDVCAAVTCDPGTTCSLLDGLCHCGGLAGPVCATGQACVQGACVAG
jgi:hypothetical protein